ncbi:MAG: ribonuclease HII [Armatimonadetes bacterium]|nr:ribonuclease HII [Akkermansiaceae bacterium]
MPSFDHEDDLVTRGFAKVAGVDEAGRGPLAGPVAAAAVILPRTVVFQGLEDSKKLSKNHRESLYARISSHAEVVWAVALVEPARIDAINILQATHLAMRLALESLSELPDIALVDGLPVKGLAIHHQSLVKGDRLSFSISAASVIAKVTRDRFMARLHEEFPVYGFATNQGYGTREHLNALQKHGPCCHHRRSFQPVSQLSLPFADRL